MRDVLLLPPAEQEQFRDVLAVFMQKLDALVIHPADYLPLADPFIDKQRRGREPNDLDRLHHDLNQLLGPVRQDRLAQWLDEGGEAPPRPRRR